MGEYCKRHYYDKRTYGDVDGDVVISASTVHGRCTSLWGAAKQYPCIECGKQAQEWAYDGTDPTQIYESYSSGGSKLFYSRFPEFYMPMCIKCHRSRDGKLAAAELSLYRSLVAVAGRAEAESVIASAMLKFEGVLENG